MNNATREVILRLKKVKEQKGLSVQDIYYLCEKNGEYVGQSTVRRFFAAGSEDKPNSFRTDTVNSIFHAVIGTEDAALSDAENAALKAVIELNDKALAEKDEAIAGLKAEVAALQIRLEAVTDMFRLAMESIGKSTTH